MIGFGKLVTGVPERGLGVFVEPSVNFTVGRLRGDFSPFLLFTGWAGAHVLLGSSPATLQVGPFVTHVRELEVGGSFWILGLRVGLSVYLL